MKYSIILFALLVAPPLCGAEQPFIESELIFPLGTLHSHSSSIV